MARLAHLLASGGEGASEWVSDGGYVSAAGFLSACLALLVARKAVWE